MALLQRQQVGIRHIGRTVTVPNDPEAKLMYYLSCVCTVLDLEDTVPRRLRNFSMNYNRLSNDERMQLLALCDLFSPDLLENKVVFEDTSSTGSTNKFLELSSVDTSMLLAGDIVIGGQTTKIAKVMTCTRAWLRNNYEQPMVMVLARLIGGVQGRQPVGAPGRRPALGAPGRRPGLGAPAGRQPAFGGNQYNERGSINGRPTLLPTPRTNYGTYRNSNATGSNGRRCCCVIL